MCFLSFPVLSRQNKDECNLTTSKVGLESYLWHKICFQNFLLHNSMVYIEHIINERTYFFLWENVPDGQEHSWLISKKVAKESAEIISFVLILHYVWHVQIEFCQCLAINGHKLTLGNLVNMVSQKEKIRIELKQVNNTLIMF